MRAVRWLVSALFNRYFPLGLLAVAVAFVLLYLLADMFVMPAYTRHNAATVVPETRGMIVDEARSTLEANDLEALIAARRHLPDLPRHTVITQDPPAETRVKPGRHVYLVVNSGEIPLVAVPDLSDMSVRQARNSLLSSKLIAGAVLKDSLPSPFRNTITRQQPEAGDSVEVGSAVRMWVSMGLGAAMRQVPDLTGVLVSEARHILSSFGLQLVVVSDASPETGANVILRTSPSAGTEVPEGSEVRGFVGD